MDHTDPFAVARAEEALRSQLQHERARSAALERDLETLRSSESFRIGHALVEGVVGRLRWNVRALPGLLSHRLRLSTPGGSPADPMHDRDGRAEGRNVVLFVAWGMDAARMEECVERVVRLQAMLVDVHPLFVVDSIDSASIRDRGYPVEYVIPLGEWRERRPPHEWGAYVTQRVSALHQKHRPRTVVVFDGHSPVSALEQGVVNSILLPKLADGEDNDLDR